MTGGCDRLTGSCGLFRPTSSQVGLLQTARSWTNACVFVGCAHAFCSVCVEGRKVFTAWLRYRTVNQALTLGLWMQWPGGPVDLKTYWPPKKLTSPFPKPNLCDEKIICVNVQIEQCIIKIRD